jgi:3-oxoacyl-[acyl-carrier-protein] synthase II
MRPFDRTARLVLAATKLAVDAAGLDVDALRQHEAGLVLGTMFCSVRTIAEFDRRAITAGVEYASVMDFANTVINAAAGQTAIWYGLRGLNATICGGVASGLQALAYGADMIRLGRSKLLLAGGGEEFSYEGLLGFERAGWLALPEERAVPFDRRRNGLLLGEGAALMMLEDADFAASRGARPLAEVRGAGIGFDRSRGKDPAEAAAALARCVRSAMTEAGAEPGHIGLLSASSGGGVATDRAEAAGVALALNGRCSTLPVTAVKSMLGETVGAGGALQTVVAMLAMERGELPGIPGLEETDDGFPLAQAQPASRAVQAEAALVTSVGLDGNCCALVLGRP